MEELHGWLLPFCCFLVLTVWSRCVDRAEMTLGFRPEYIYTNTSKPPFYHARDLSFTNCRCLGMARRSDLVRCSIGHGEAEAI